MRGAATLLLLVVAARSGGMFGAERSPAVPDDAFLEASGAVIGEIEIEADDIFNPDDPKENNWLFRSANFLHISTRPGVVRSLILFRTGDPYRARILRESERILRAQSYFYDASIEPVRFLDGRVDVRVRTRDVWTLTPGIGFSRAGGKNQTRIGIEEGNLLGLGKEITIRRSKDIDRVEILYRYRDPAVLGSRVTFEARYDDNSDGFGRRLTVARPFYAQDVRWGVFGRAFDNESVVSVYDRGGIFAAFQQSVRYLETWGGIGRRSGAGVILRTKFGYTFEERRFAPDPGGAAAPPGGIPPARTVAYPWVGIETFKDRFVEVHNLDLIARTEDVYLGSYLDARVGVSAAAFGGRGPARAVFEGAWRGGRGFDGRNYLLARAGISGRYGAGTTENLVLGGALRTLIRQGERWAFTAEFSAEAARALDPELQIVLGGDTGLRGYPVRYVRGDRKWLATVEERFYSDWEVLRLVHVGAAVFADVGRAWFESGGPEDLGTLRDVGIGLRLSSSRSAEGAMLHVDLALPLDGEAGIRRSQLVIKSRERF